jgi:NADP-dependent 3-hydroxy acid dehydrogenase YdfG
MTDISESGLLKAMAKAKEMAPQMTGQVDFMKCDVTKETDVMAVVERVDEWGGVDVMFNNAGIMHGQDDGKQSNLHVTKCNCITELS